MPYKNKKKQAEYMRRYRTPYMQDYRKRQAQRQRAVEKALGLDLVRKQIKQSNKQLFDLIYGKPQKAKQKRRR